MAHTFLPPTLIYMVLGSGDIGHLDDDGFLFLVDRAKDMIITSD